MPPPRRDSSLSITSTMTANHGQLPQQQELQDPNVTAEDDTTTIDNDNVAQINMVDQDGDVNSDNSNKTMPSKAGSSEEESRDVSICSRNIRDSLRRQVSMRNNTFTKYERSFLKELTIEGSDREVELALQTVQNEDLFFDHCTPRHLKQNNDDGIGLNISDDGNTSNTFEDDATRDGDVTSVATAERRGLLGVATSSLASSSLKNGSSSSSNNNNNRKNNTTSSTPSFIPPKIIGSQRRHHVLQRRRSESSINLTKLWRAHENGLAVTVSGSRKSLLRRESSVSSFGSAVSGMSGLSVLFGKQAHPAQYEIFRSGNDDGKYITPKNNKSKLQRSLPPMTRRSPNLRSKSMTLAMLTSPRDSSQRSLPKIPEPSNFSNPRSSSASYGRRKSVTFHEFDEQLEFDTNKETTSIITVDNLETNKISSTQQQIPKKSIRRAVSDSQLPFTDEFNDDQEQKKQLLQRESSNSSIPSLHHGQPLRESISSVPSLHHGNAIRQDSLASFASLHHATPIRQDSTSIIEQNSVASFASLHHGNPVRQDSLSTIPSLHHGRPICQYGVTEEVASAWVQLESSSQSESELIDGEQKQMSPVVLPHDMTLIPTSRIIANTIYDDDLSVFPAISKREDSASPPKPVFLRQASRNVYEGEGVEVTEIEDAPIDDDNLRYQYREPLNPVRNLSLFSNNDFSRSIRTANSFDDVSLFSSFGKQQRTSDVFRNLRRSLSDENMSALFLGPSKEFLLRIPNSSDASSETFVDEISDGGSTSWEMESASPNGRFDAWNILQDEYVNGYGGGGTLGFKILGTSVADESAQPHVLSPPLMESLQAFLPSSKSGENFYMKYSMIRDGAHLQTLLKRARGFKYSILAIETIDGEVFGSFTGEAWRKSWNYFGTGESFLWKMRHSRLEKTNGILDQAQKESEIDVYPYTGKNGFIQLCTHDRVAVGGGIPDLTSAEKKTDEPSRSNSNDNTENVKSHVEERHNWGFGLALQSDLLQGSSSPCVTFGSPSLSKTHQDGSFFEIMNVELWTTTPCMTEEDAEKLELGKLFLHQDSNANINNSCKNQIF